MAYHLLDTPEVAFERALLVLESPEGFSCTHGSHADVEQGTHQRAPGQIVLHHEEGFPRFEDADYFTQSELPGFFLELVEGMGACSRIKALAGKRQAGGSVSPHQFSRCLFANLHSTDEMGKGIKEQALIVERARGMVVVRRGPP